MLHVNLQWSCYFEFFHSFYRFHNFFLLCNVSVTVALSACIGIGWLRVESCPWRNATFIFSFLNPLHLACHQFLHICTVPLLLSVIFEGHCHAKVFNYFFRSFCLSWLIFCHSLCSFGHQMSSCHDMPCPQLITKSSWEFSFHVINLSCRRVCTPFWVLQTVFQNGVQVLCCVCSAFFIMSFFLTTYKCLFSSHAVSIYLCTYQNSVVQHYSSGLSNCALWNLERLFTNLRSCLSMIHMAFNFDGE